MHWPPLAGSSFAGWQGLFLRVCPSLGDMPDVNGGTGRPVSKNADLALLGTEGFGTLYSHNGVLLPHTASRQYQVVGPGKLPRTTVGVTSANTNGRVLAEYTRSVIVASKSDFETDPSSCD